MKEFFKIIYKGIFYEKYFEWKVVQEKILWRDVMKNIYEKKKFLDLDTKKITLGNLIKIFL